MLLDLLNKIGAESGRNSKIQIIKENCDNAQFRRVLDLALNPYTNFHIKKIPSYPSAKPSTSSYETLDWGLTQLARLTSREFTGHAAIAHLEWVLTRLPTPDAVVIERIIGKDLRCGMADGTVNAAIPGLIPTYPCLLARPFDEKNIKNIFFPAYSQLKADGLRVNFRIEGTAVTICGRSGRPIDLLGTMDEDMIKLGEQFPYPVVFDGELVVVDASGKIIDRKTGNGIINKAIKGTISEAEARMVRVQLWDVIPLDQFIAGVSKDTYNVRLTALQNAITAAAPSTVDLTASALKGTSALKYWIIPGKVVNNLEEAVEHFNELLAAGEEGTILKNFKGLWEDTRSKHLVKMKAEKTCDLEIIGWNPGEGQYAGQVGSLICASSDRLVEASISGFSQDLRKEITRTIDALMGTIVEVLYNERISSKSAGRAGIDSLFLPRFNAFRTDKLVADSTKEIK